MPLFISQKIRRVVRFAEKDFKTYYRFKLGFISALTTPLPTLMSFFLAYFSVFSLTGVISLGFIDRVNYLTYLLSAAIVYSFFKGCWFKTNMLHEKYWQTLDGIMLLPVSRVYTLFGKGLRTFAEVALGVLPYALLFVLISPPITSYANFFMAILSLLMILVIFISLDFIVSSIGIAEEGIAQILWSHVPQVFFIFGCLYYPIDILPKILWPIVYLNPLYHCVNIFRMAFMPVEMYVSVPAALSYLLLLTVLLPFLAVKVFTHVFNKYGVRGY